MLKLISSMILGRVVSQWFFCDGWKFLDQIRARVPEAGGRRSLSVVALIIEQSAIKTLINTFSAAGVYEMCVSVVVAIDGHRTLFV